jgi:hypothetical protein
MFFQAKLGSLGGLSNAVSILITSQALAQPIRVSGVDALIRWMEVGNTFFRVSGALWAVTTSYGRVVPAIICGPAFPFPCGSWRCSAGQAIPSGRGSGFGSNPAPGTVA